MQYFSIGDLVARKSYGGDVYFSVSKILYRYRREPIYILKGVIHRLIADAFASDLVRLDNERVNDTKTQFLSSIKRHSPISVYPDLFIRLKKRRLGNILHLDGDEDFMERCLAHYKEAGIACVGKAIDESKQPYHVRELLEMHRPDVLVLTGHDSMKKNNDGADSLSNYSNSGYFVQSVKEARKFEENSDKLCIFAGACQSFYEEIMSAGANFASSPGRILINALDPAMVAEKIAVTDSRRVVTPREAASLTESGSKAVWGKNSKGQMRWI